MDNSLFNVTCLGKSTVSDVLIIIIIYPPGRLRQTFVYCKQAFACPHAVFAGQEIVAIPTAAGVTELLAGARLGIVVKPDSYR